MAVGDDGPGVPEMEQAVVGREEPVTQLSHSQGLGLWLSKWLTESVGGDLGFAERDGDGRANSVVLRLERADA
ncbi:hypothetical protein [Halosegnis marinus]|uniref:hypothetical protein n=1 Tax=Halosegnis marinus TaxID=3034023 RepID=UPI003611C525